MFDKAHILFKTFCVFKLVAQLDNLEEENIIKLFSILTRYLAYFSHIVWGCLLQTSKLILKLLLPCIIELTDNVGANSDNSCPHTHGWLGYGPVPKGDGSPLEAQLSCTPALFPGHI